MIHIRTLLAIALVAVAVTSAYGQGCGCGGDASQVQASQTTPRCDADASPQASCPEEPTAIQGCQGCGPQGGHGGHHGGSPQGTPPGEVTVDKNGVQKATIVVDNGFSPLSLTVKAGQPVELTFDTRSRGCATSVVFDGLDIKKELNNGKKTVVKFTPKKAGTYSFACPMKMVKGTLIVK